MKFIKFRRPFTLWKLHFSRMCKTTVDLSDTEHLQNDVKHSLDLEPEEQEPIKLFATNSGMHTTLINYVVSPLKQESYLADLVLQIIDHKEYAKENVHKNTWRNQQKLGKLFFNPLTAIVLLLMHLYFIASFLRDPFDDTDHD